MAERVVRGSFFKNDCKCFEEVDFIGGLVEDEDEHATSSSDRITLAPIMLFELLELLFSCRRYFFEGIIVLDPDYSDKWNCCCCYWRRAAAEVVVKGSSDFFFFFSDYCECFEGRSSIDEDEGACYCYAPRKF